MHIDILRVELTTDPLGRGYSGMTDQQAADDLNTVNRSRNRITMSGDEVYHQTDPAEFGSLQNVEKQLWMAFCGRETINPQAAANEQTVVTLFGGGSTTVANLQAARVEQVSRAVELGINRIVLPGHVAEARLP